MCSSSLLRLPAGDQPRAPTEAGKSNSGEVFRDCCGHAWWAEGSSMAQPVEYDAFADVYDRWVDTEPVTRRNRPFYVTEYLRTSGVVAEMGVGNGRIAIEAARQGKAVVGVDSSREMLKACRERAEAAGVSDLLTLIHEDMRSFRLTVPADLIAIPFHTIGFLITQEEKLSGLRNIFDQLRPRGRLVLDHFVFRSELAERYSAPKLLAEYTDSRSGHQMLFWACVRTDAATQTLGIVPWTDEIGDDGRLLRRTYRHLTFSWIDPPQTRSLLEHAGFRVDALYGDFDCSPFTDESYEQIWIASRPP